MTTRFRLTAFLIGIVLAANAAIALVTVLHSRKAFTDEVQTRVRLDLGSARARSGRG